MIDDLTERAREVATKTLDECSTVALDDSIVGACIERDHDAATELIAAALRAERKLALGDQVSWLEREADRLDTEQRAEWSASTRERGSEERSRLMRSSSAKYELRNALRRAVEHLESMSSPEPSE